MLIYMYIYPTGSHINVFSERSKLTRVNIIFSNINIVFWKFKRIYEFILNISGKIPAGISGAYQ
jgi:hypothetical protein